MSNESATRQQIIDHRLKEAGWDVHDRTQVAEEFTVAKVSEMQVKEASAFFVARELSDYVLLGKNGKPLAVIEAKRTSKDAELGREQAKQYCLNIQAEHGGELPFCFYTNGHEIFFWDIGNYPPRRVIGFPTRDDLERMQYIRRTRKPLTHELINTDIAGRDYQVRAIRSVLEGIEQKKRDFLLVMATGTGKTRTCIALADTLMRAGYAERILFLVDRIALREQALAAFKEHLRNEPRWPNEGAQSLIGFDIDSTMVRLGLMNLMMHGIDEPMIDYKDTLSRSFKEESEYDIVMANPPFTGSVDKGDINERLTIGTTKSELLFVENIYRLLKTGGTACVIVPQGVLFGSGKAFKTLRQLLVDRCELKAVITMPSGVFKPYAGVSTAILLFTKVWAPDAKVTKPATKKVWFYDMQADGYSLDDKRTKQDCTGDLQDIVEKFQLLKPKTESDRTQKHFTVPYADIKAEDYDLSFSRYHEDTYEEIQYEAPSVILDKLIEAEVGDVAEKDLAKIKSGIVRELLELREMIG